jgi:hypothetical protein
MEEQYTELELDSMAIACTNHRTMNTPGSEEWLIVYEKIRRQLEEDLKRG